MYEATLSQFLNLCSKQSISAKLKQVRKYKNQNYTPYLDYWKPVRDQLTKVLCNNLSFDSFAPVIDACKDPSKKMNFTKNIKKLKNYFSKHDYKILSSKFSPTYYYSSDNTLRISTKPEFDIQIDGNHYFLKVHYRLKKKGDKLIQNNIAPSLMLIDKATKDDQHDNAKVAILNLQSRKLVTLDTISSKYKDQDLLQHSVDSISSLYKDI